MCTLKFQSSFQQCLLDGAFARIPNVGLTHFNVFDVTNLDNALTS